MKLPENPVAGCALTFGFTFTAVFLFARAKLYSPQDGLTLAICTAAISTLSNVCYYRRSRFLWHDFNSWENGGTGEHSPFVHATDWLITVAVVLTAYVAFVTVVHQNF